MNIGVMNCLSQTSEPDMILGLGSVEHVLPHHEGVTFSGNTVSDHSSPQPVTMEGGNKEKREKKDGVSCWRRVKLTFKVVVQRLFDDTSNFGEFLVLGPTANGKLGKRGSISVPRLCFSFDRGWNTL
jgi:hypothetical protein